MMSALTLKDRYLVPWQAMSSRICSNTGGYARVRGACLFLSLGRVELNVVLVGPSTELAGSSESAEMVQKHQCQKLPRSPSALLTPFSGQGSSTKIDYRKKGI